MKIKLIALEINEVLGNKIHMSQSCLEIALFEERLPSFNDIPMIL
jgi:hypothetical protein